MKLYSCYTRSHKRLYKAYFLKSLPPAVENESYYLDVRGRGDFLSAGFLEALRRKTRLIIESVEANRGSIIVWSDIDIFFVRDFTASVMKVFDEDRELDVAFQREFRNKDEVNCGFVAMLCNDRVKAVYEQVSASMAVHRKWNEQKIINDLISTDVDLGWTHLPMSFYARTHGWPPPDNIVLYHANATFGSDGVGQKERQFKEFGDYLGVAVARPRRRPKAIVRAARRRLADAFLK